MDKKIAASKALSQRPSNAITQSEWSDWRALLSGLFVGLVVGLR